VDTENKDEEKGDAKTAAVVATNRQTNTSSSDENKKNKKKPIKLNSTKMSHDGQRAVQFLSQYDAGSISEEAAEAEAEEAQAELGANIQPGGNLIKPDDGSKNIIKANLTEVGVRLLSVAIDYCKCLFLLPCPSPCH